MFVYKRLTTTKLNKIFLCFTEDLTASSTAKIVGVNRNTVNRYFMIIREKLVRHSISEYNKIKHENPISGLHFEAKTVLGKKIQRIIKERPVLGLLKKGKKIFVTFIHDYSHENLFSRLQEEFHAHTGEITEKPDIAKDSELGLSDAEAMPEVDTAKHPALHEYNQYRVYWKEQGDTENVKDIDNFLLFAKKRLAKFNGCVSGSLLLHLKECEFRYNHRNEDIFKLIKKIFQTF